LVRVDGQVVPVGDCSEVFLVPAQIRGSCPVLDITVVPSV
jgi:hypothetical protein